MTVGELEDRMSASELANWMRYEAHEPFLPFRLDLVGGLLASLLANIHRGKNTRAFEPTDFMPVFQRNRSSMTIEDRLRNEMPEPEDEMDAKMQYAVLALGGRVVH